MDYQFVGFVFACIGAAMSVLYLVLGVALWRRVGHREVEGYDRRSQR